MFTPTTNRLRFCVHIQAIPRDIHKKNIKVQQQKTNILTHIIQLSRKEKLTTTNQIIIFN